MLVLSRKKNESIVINNDITIVVVEIRGDKVRLGVEAPKEIPVSPLMQQRVEEAIKYNLAMRGIERVDKDGDVFVTYHAKAKDEVVIYADHYGYGYGRGWGRWGMGGMGSSTARTHTSTKGSLIFDVWSAKTKNMIYRGTITDTVSDKPEKNEKKINKGAEKLFEEFDKQYNKEKKKKDQ